MNTDRAFQPDDDYDSTYASDGVSRFGAYLAQYSRWFDDDGTPTTDPRTFAAAAWRIAQSPIMAPAYIRAHGRVQVTEVRWDDDHRPAVCIDLAVSSPPEAAGLAHPWRHWTRDAAGHWVPPHDYARPNAVTVLTVAIPLTGTALPQPRYQGDLAVADTPTAKLAVRAICGTLNAALAYILAFDPLTADAR
jgi:hypothetical protein